MKVRTRHERCRAVLDLFHCRQLTARLRRCDQRLVQHFAKLLGHPTPRALDQQVRHSIDTSLQSAVRLLLVLTPRRRAVDRRIPLHHRRDGQPHWTPVQSLDCLQYDEPLLAAKPNG